MPEAAKKAPVDQQQYADLQSAYDELRQEHQAVKQQLSWLQRQVFGRKSEKRLIEQPAHSGLLFDALPESDDPAPTEQVSYTRRKGTKDRGDAVTDAGLRFNDEVPVEVIHVKDPEVEAIPEEHREVIDEKVTRRLAQRPGSYVVLEYRRPVAPGSHLDKVLYSVDVCPRNPLRRE